MSGPVQGMVTLNNMRIFVVAILGVLIEYPPKTDRRSLKPATLGQINKHGDIFLNKDDMIFLQKTFKQMKTNRA
jgi:hypothetical protein